MNYAYHWRKAMTVSVCLHLFLLVAAGYLAAGWAAPVPVKELIIEMDLVVDPAKRAASSPDIPQPPTPPDAPRPALAEPVPAENPVPETAPSVIASNLSMTEVQTPVFTGAAASTPAEAAPASSSTRSGTAAPGILSKVDPVYPSAARRAGQEGTVVLKIQILANGRPGEISVARSTGYAVLDEAAVAAVESWRFVPAKDLSSGRAVACTTTLPVSFRLNGN